MEKKKDLKKKKKKEGENEKPSRKWRKMLSWTERAGLHTHDFHFNSEEAAGINWRRETEEMHVGKMCY